MFQLKGERVLVSGAAQGLGASLAKEFAKEGCNLVLLDLRKEAMNEVAEYITNEYKVNVETYACDVSNVDMVNEVAAKVGKIDVLVNNAGTVIGKPLLELSDNEIRRTINVNTFSHFWMTRAYLPSMKENKHGYIVSVSSILGLVPSAGLTDYVASKHAVNGYHEALRLELEAERLDKFIHTTLVCPSHMNTQLFSTLKRNRMMDLFSPQLSTDDAAHSIVRAIKHKRIDIIVPEKIAPGFTLMHLVPNRLKDYVYKAFGGQHAMDEFFEKRREIVKEHKEDIKKLKKANELRRASAGKSDSNNTKFEMDKETLNANTDV
mmetsp:Transcript_10914/g.40698  ORF Transcript_10914/g.40698 Transcript_10914/m.40698 type:complete len:320 (-) Transcript_10914:172-1131(-)|eukprot:CAMPEP_0117442446 /NCGR_PEP_ID=MMETSP0759-20121206/4155_1 /TAXON_ID=63605 /ORGANISM="Percolomonas cosmopolitus, Strain WS" /LENGTH=319 /DNA_ID=CAMNT_0005234333 /DNA_START=229 /DNA_END=1188 /DNA_ORIENTATION=-